MKRSLLILAAGLLGIVSNARGDGFIVVERPFLVRPGHFPFAPLEVTSHHVEVKIDSQVAVTSIDQEFYNPNDQRLEGTYMNSLSHCANSFCGRTRRITSASPREGERKSSPEGSYASGQFLSARKNFLAESLTSLANSSFPAVRA